MFIGEFSCLIVYFLIPLVTGRRRQTEEEGGSRKFNPLIFLPAAMCDMCGTSIMYIGLNLTYASSFQMLRGNCHKVNGYPIRGSNSGILFLPPFTMAVNSDRKDNICSKRAN